MKQIDNYMNDEKQYLDYLTHSFSNGNMDCKTNIFALIDRMYDSLYCDLQKMHVFLKDAREKDIVDSNHDILTFVTATDATFWSKAIAYAGLIEETVDEIYIPWSSTSWVVGYRDARINAVKTLYHFQKLKNTFEKRFVKKYPNNIFSRLSFNETNEDENENLNLWRYMLDLFENPGYWIEYINIVKTPCSNGDKNLNGKEIWEKITLANFDKS